MTKLEKLLIMWVGMNNYGCQVPSPDACLGSRRTAPCDEAPFFVF